MEPILREKRRSRVCKGENSKSATQVFLSSLVHGRDKAPGSLYRDREVAAPCHLPENHFCWKIRNFGARQLGHK